MGNSTAGGNISVNCTVNEKVLGFLNSPNVTWTGKVDDHLAGQSAILSFDTLNTSHGKNYTCLGSIQSPAISETYSVTKQYSLIVNSKKY